MSNGKRRETVHMLQRHTPLGLAEIGYGCNSGVTKPLDAGGMGCGGFAYLVIFDEQKAPAPRGL